MVMRVGGLATGMDIESMVNKLMEAERMPLTRMEQDHTQLTWKRDAFRDINRGLLELDELIKKMKRPSTYRSKIITSTQDQAVSGASSSNGSLGSYRINVSQLATMATNVSGEIKDIDPNKPLSEQTGASEWDINQPIKFSTFDDDGKEVEHEINISENDSLNDVLAKITKEDNNVRAFFDANSNKVIIETTRTGQYNSTKDGPEIKFEAGSFFGTVLEMDTLNEKGGENAKFQYNNSVELESKSNSYELNGVTFQFHNVTEGNATLNVKNDVESSFEAIMKFINTYNEVVDKLNGSQSEEKYREFPPLTDEQKKEMSEDEIKKWEEKAQSGILRGETTISSGMTTMRQGWYAKVETGDEFTYLTQIGITTSIDYMDGGKLVVDEDRLREALNDNPAGVENLFINNSQDESRGLVHRLGDAVKDTMSKIEGRAGKSTHTLDNYTLGKRMKELNERITSFEAKMLRVENRYWNQFTQMEKAIQRMNNQSAQLFSQFG